MVQTLGSVTLEEHQAGDTTWVAVRARGADWSWLTREDAVRLAQHLIAAYGQTLNSNHSAATRLFAD